MATIAMWMLAEQIGMECKWMLLLPVEHSAYVGLIANAYIREQKTTGLDFSTYEAVVTLIMYGLIGYLIHSESLVALYGITVCMGMKVLLRWLEYITIYGLYFKHRILLATVSLLPGVSIICAIRARRI